LGAVAAVRGVSEPFGAPFVPNNDNSPPFNADHHFLVFRNASCLQSLTSYENVELNPPTVRHYRRDFVVLFFAGIFSNRRP
jgi:hypothetical protein